MTAFEIYRISDYFQWVGSIAIAICCLLHFKKRVMYIRTLGLYAVTSIVFSLAQRVLVWFFAHTDMNAIGNGFVLLEAWLFSLLFYYATNNKIFRRRIFISALLYTFFYLTSFFFFFEHSFSFIRFSRDFLGIFYALAYFYFLLQELPEENLLKFPMFWINSAIIMFFSGTLMLSFMRDYIVNVLKDDLARFWAFRNFFRFSFCLALTYAGWLDLCLIYQKESAANNPVNS